MVWDWQSVMRFAFGIVKHLRSRRKGAIAPHPVYFFFRFFHFHKSLLVQAIGATPIHYHALYPDKHARQAFHQRSRPFEALFVDAK